MPNWSDNTVTFTGNPEAITLIKERIDKVLNSTDDQVFLLNEFVPMPDELRDTTASFQEKTSPEAVALKEKYGAVDWYDWQVSNWGVKWGDSDLRLHADRLTDDVSVTVTFHTPWGQPQHALATIAHQTDCTIVCSSITDDGNPPFSTIYEPSGHTTVSDLWLGFLGPEPDCSDEDAWHTWWEEREFAVWDALAAQHDRLVDLVRTGVTP